LAGTYQSKLHILNNIICQQLLEVDTLIVGILSLIQWSFQYGIFCSWCQDFVIFL